jgi:hypothetical protein
MSWIAYWRELTGETPSTCAYAHCNRPATQGGHLWIQPFRRYAIVPICAGCNRPSNAACQQQADGRQPALRAVVAVQVTKTADMRAAPRRRAHSKQRIPRKKHTCDRCGKSLKGRPKSHTRCRSCFRAA